jgi:4-methylaminobutanoate oxidase (formaldehyde-forming)
VPHDFSYGLFEEDWDHFAHIYDYGADRFPFLKDVEIQSMVNGPESFTIDMHYIMGEAPDLSKLFVCTGMCSSGIASAGGAGFALADWIVNGEPKNDMWDVDIRRFHPQSANLTFLKERCRETMGLHFSMPWPKRELYT